MTVQSPADPRTWPSGPTGHPAFIALDARSFKAAQSPLSVVQQKAVFREEGEVSNFGNYEINVSLYGAFDIKNSRGDRIAITGKKSAAIIALLCHSDDMRHERSWIMSMLWGSREIEQAQASLRQELLKLRRLLNSDAKILHVSRTHLWLDTAYVRVEERLRGRQFLEGMDIRGEEAFEDWLREQRVRHEPKSHQARPGIANTGPPMNEVSVEVEIGSQLDGNATSDARLMFLKSLVIRGLCETGGVSVAEGGRTTPDVVLNISPVSIGGRLRLFVNLSRASDNLVMCSAMRVIASDETRLAEFTEEVAVHASEIVDQTLSSIVRHAASLTTEGHLALKHAREGVLAFFSRLPGSAHVVDQKFALANEIRECSSFWAWRAYNATLHLEDGAEKTGDDIPERALLYSSRALELDSHNALTWALLSHVSSFVFRDFDKAAMCLDQALYLGQDNIMAQDALALFGVYTGDLQRARAAAFRTEKMGRHLPYRYCFATTQSMIEVLAGNFSSAVRHGERALALMPIGAANLYPPTLRYLAIGHAKLGEIERAIRIVDQIQTAEGPLKASAVGTKSYPMPSQMAAELMKESLMIIGK